jgi:hypothetical protein
VRNHDHDPDRDPDHDRDPRRACMLKFISASA